MVTFPQPWEIGVEIEPYENSSWKPYLDGGYFSLPLQHHMANFSLSTIQCGIRYFRPSRTFFWSFGMGYRRSELLADSRLLKLDEQWTVNEGKISLNSIFGQIGVGWIFKIQQKIDLGIDLGYQLPWVGGASLHLQDSGAILVRADSISRIARLALPQITLLRLAVHLE